ncbi:MAG TPA: hypothetical protein VKM72_36095 [Thermoanaerobaculia bacterium]|nr:hypothetical protein [Thermoanaerobaculia bacterium]
MATETLSKEIGGWEAVITNIKARSPELPQFGPTVQELEAVVIEGKEIQSIQDVQRSELRETNRRSRDLRRRGRSLRNRLAAGVQSVFGVDSMALVAFGVKPRLQKPRRRLTPTEKVAKLEAQLEVAKAAKAAAEKKNG